MSACGEARRGTTRGWQPSSSSALRLAVLLAVACVGSVNAEECFGLADEFCEPCPDGSNEHDGVQTSCPFDDVDVAKALCKKTICNMCRFMTWRVTTELGSCASLIC